MSAGNASNPHQTDPFIVLDEQIADGGVEFIRFEQSDTHGIARSKTVPVRHFKRFAQEGLNFLLGHLGLDVQAGVAPHTGYLEERGFPDSRLTPDLDTFRILPWADKTARVLCEPYHLDGRPAMAAPRVVGNKVLDALRAMGYRLLGGFEYEFYLVDARTRQPAFPGIQIFATLRNTFDESLVYDILRGMSAVGVDIITANAEYGPGQMEINFAPAWDIAVADTAFTFKNGVKELAQRRGLMASFMTKPWIEQSANGCHFHQSLWQGERNAFVDPTSADGLSAVCRHFLAGQLAHAPALCALASPTVNCPKRYKVNSFAPTNATWGVENRTTAIRVKATGDDNTHIENRLGCGGSNPYLLMAASLAAGIDGLRHRMEPPTPLTGIAYGLAGVTNLPTRLDEALAALEQDEALIEGLGPEFVELFVAVKRHEITKAKAAIDDYESPAFNDRVDDWEVNEYFEFL
jgi:glutamine synthetase